MATDWSLTIDCTDPTRVSAFWEVALRYIKRPPPEGHADWKDYYASIGYDISSDFYEGAYLTDPDGKGPNLFFQLVPDRATGKNWFHLDLKVSGGRQRPAAERVPLIEAEVARLEAAGGRVLRRVEHEGALDFVVLLDPEDNQLCVA